MVVGVTGSIAKAWTPPMPAPSLIQLSPLLSLLNTPSLLLLPAYTVVVVDGSIAREPMEESRPPPMFLHVAPPSSLLKGAPLRVHAYNVLGVVGSIANPKTTGSVRPSLMGLQLSPPSSVLYTPI